MSNTKRNSKTTKIKKLEEEHIEQTLDEISEREQISILKQTKIHSGPLPPPEILKEYNQSYDGAAKDIVNMAKKEQNFRHLSTFFGQLSALLIGLSGLAVTAYLGVNSQPVLAGLIGFGSLGSLVGTFLYNKKQSK